MSALLLQGTILYTQTALVVNGNVGSAIPFPFSNIPEERSAVMKLRPSLGLQYNKELGGPSFLKFNALYSVKAVDFSATLVDQPYNGYVEYDVGGQIAEGYVEDAYFSGISNGSYNMKYIELNASYARKLAPTFSVYAGIYLAFLLQADNEIYVKGTVSHGVGLPPISSEFDRTENYSHHVNGTDFGFQVGVEHKIYKRLNVNGQFSSSLHSIYDNELTALDFSMLNMYATLGITYFITSSIYR